MAVPHYAFPLTVADGVFATVDQDTIAEISQAVAVLVLTRKGRRADIADYGIPDPVMRTGFDDSAVAAAIARWEPRAAAAITHRFGSDQLAVQVNLRVAAARKVTA